MSHRNAERSRREGYFRPPSRLKFRWNYADRVIPSFPRFEHSIFSIFSISEAFRSTRYGWMKARDKPVEGSPRATRLIP